MRQALVIANIGSADYALEHGVWVPNEDEDVWTFVRPDMIYELKVLKECDDDD